MRLFNSALDNIGYWERLSEIEGAWREFVEDALIEGGSWVAGGYLLRVGGKFVSLGYRKIKAYRYYKATKT